MQSYVMTEWLKEKRRQHVGRYLLLASATLLGGWLAAFLTFLAAYGAIGLGVMAIGLVCTLAAGKTLHCGHPVCYWGALAATGGLFYLHHKKHPEPMLFVDAPVRSDLPVWKAATTLLSDGLLGISLTAIAEHRAWDLVLLVLFSGPRLLRGCHRLARRAWLLIKVDLKAGTDIMLRIVNSPQPIWIREFQLEGRSNTLENLMAMRALVMVDDNYVWMPMNLSEDLTRISSTINAEIKEEIK